MNKLSLLFLLLMGANSFAQNIWSGEKITFSKADGADYSIATNQDQITDKVILTRGNDGGQIFNIANESNADKETSPSGTEWAMGTTENIDNLIFSTFREVGKPKTFVDVDLVLHLLEEDIYLDVKFTAWSTDKAGGFAYERSTETQVSISKFKNTKARIFPNPASSKIEIKAIDMQTSYIIYNSIGKAMFEGIYQPYEKIDISSLNNGIYFLSTAEGKTHKFVKK